MARVDFRTLEETSETQPGAPARPTRRQVPGSIGAGVAAALAPQEASDATGQIYGVNGGNTLL